MSQVVKHKRARRAVQVLRGLLVQVLKAFLCGFFRLELSM
jgi:ribosomal protein L31E